jgi:hypothetical protein
MRIVSQRATILGPVVRQTPRVNTWRTRDTRVVVAALSAVLAVPLAAQAHASTASSGARGTIIDSIHLVAVSRGEGSWYVNQMVRGAFKVELLFIQNEHDCRNRKVTFQATQGATAAAALTAPTVSVRGEWNPEDKRCYSQTRWRLNDVPGEQELVATIERDTAALVPANGASRPSSLAWRTSAHMPPTLIAGFSYAFGPNPPPESIGDSTLVKRGQPFFGVEFGVLIPFSRSELVSKIAQRIRLTAGTSYRSPGFDFYAGISPLALIDGLRTTGLPVQLTVGRRWSRRGNDTYFVGGTANALALFSTIIAKL